MRGTIVCENGQTSCWTQGEQRWDWNGRFALVTEAAAIEYFQQTSGRDKLDQLEGKRRRGQQRTRWLDSVIEATNMNLTKLREAVEDRRAWCALVHGVTKSRTRLND